MGTPKVSKVIMIGDGNTGKTSLRRRYMGDTFKKSYAMTIGADFSIKRMGEFLIQIYDLAGQPGFKLMRKNYYAGAQAAIVVFDITKEQSLQNTSKWVSEMVMAQGKNVPMVLVANKIDLRDSSNNFITTEEGKSYAKKLSQDLNEKVLYMETSALTGENVDNMFETLIDYMKEKYN